MSTTIAQNSFLPTQVPGIQLWLDAADPSTITGTSPVTAWNDKSGNGNNGTASGSPVLLANSINSSYPSIYFDGASSIAGATVNSGTTLTAFCILQTTDANLNTNGRLLSLSAPGRNDYDNVQSCIPYDQFNNAQINTNRGNTGTPQVVYNVPVGTSALVATIFDGNTSNIFYANGSLYVTATAASWNQSFSITTYCIGNAINPNSAWYKGRIGEIILYNTAVTTFQRQQVEGYLAQKWGLQTSLPPNHPYRYSAYFTNQGYVSTIVSPVNTNRFTNASFLPTQIPGCKLWLDGADQQSMTFSSGTAISVWKDKSGNAYNATGVGGPTFITGGGVSFNGSQVFSLSAPYSQTACTFFLVGKANAGSGQQYFFNFDSTNNGISVIGNGEGSGYIDLYSNPVSWGRLSTTGSTNIFLVSESHVSNGNYIGLLNGSQIVNSAFTAGAATQVVCLGGPYSNISGAGQVGIYEFILFNSYLSTAQRQQVEGYLAWKWGLNVNLPPTHPYKNTSAVFVTQPTTLAILGANPYNNKTGFGTFKSKSISSLQFWLDAADTSSITFTSSNTISAWNDKSGNGFNLYQATSSNQPTYFSNYITLGTASNYYMNMPQGAVNNASTWSMFFVINPINSTNWIMAKQWDGVNSLNILSMTYNGYRSSGTTGVVYFKPQNSATLFSGPAALATSTVQMVSMSYDGTNMYYYLNGNLGSTTAGTFGIINVGSATTCTLGAWVVAGGLEYSGTTNFKLGELQFFNTALTINQRQQVEGYLAWKWGLQGSLPGTHAYKLFPPPP